MNKDQGDCRSYDSLDVVYPQNKEKFIQKMENTKPERLCILKMVKDVLEKNEVKYWLDGGSLLGAFRNGKMIDHDLDIDFAVLGEEDLEKAAKLLESIKPQGYTLRVTRGSTKIQLERNGNSELQHAKKVEFCKEGLGPTDPKNVWVDIMMYSYNKEEGHVWAKYFYGGLDKNRYKLEWIFPLSTVRFEEMEVSCPNNSEAYLTEMYGYLGTDCYYSKKTKKYHKR